MIAIFFNSIETTFDFELILYSLNIVIGYYQPQQPMYSNQPQQQQQASKGGMGGCMAW